MDMIPVVLYFNGTWSDSNEYNNFEVTGILVPTTCSFSEMSNLVCNAIMVDTTTTKIAIKFHIRSNIPPIIISNEATFRFYMELCQKSDEQGKFPLIIEEIHNNGGNTTLQSLSSEEENRMQSLSTTRSTQFNSDLIPLATQYYHSETQYAEQLAIEAVDQEQYIQQDIGHNKEQNDDVISDPNEGEVRLHQTYKDKKVLTQAIRLHSIRQHRQHKVQRTSGRDFVLVCIDDEKCTWKLRASKFRKTSMFKVREFNNVHTCSSDIMMGDHRQANSEMVSDCIMHRLSNLKKIYTPTDIVEDMMTEYNVSISYQKAWRSKEKALEKVRGNPHDYSLIPSWLHMLEKNNPGNDFKYVGCCPVLYILVAVIKIGLHIWKPILFKFGYLCKMVWLQS